MKTLAELESVDWKCLNHAYGEADDVPGLIRDLASKRVKRRDAAFEKLYSNLWHQGSVYSATPHAVPFLVGLLQIPKLPDPASVLSYLSALATGASYLDVHQSCGLPFFDEKRNTKEFKEQLSLEIGWATNTRTSVAEGLQYYLPFLDSDDLKIQTNAFFLLGELEGGMGRQHLCKRILSERELHSDVLATAIFSLRRDESGNQEIIERFRCHESPIVKYGVAMLCSLFAKDLATVELLKNLVDFSTTFSLAHEKYEHLPFVWNFPLSRYSGQFLVELDTSLHDEVIDYLISKFPETEYDSHEHSLDTLLRLTFSKKVIPSNLNAQQLSALTVIHNHELTWESTGISKWASFDEFRIPSNRSEFIKLLKTQNPPS